MLELHALQAEASLGSVNVPEAHDAHMASSAVAEPLVKRCPAGQPVTEWVLQAAVSVVEENVPEVQEEHAASSAVAEP